MKKIPPTPAQLVRGYDCLLTRTFGMALAGLLAAPLLPTTAFSQGSLTPPGPPGPTMKTLQQVEPRTPISLLPFTITSGGAFYLTANLTGVSGQHGITIAANDVTLDLNGFALIGVPGSSNGVFVSVVSGLRTNVAIVAGAIRAWGGDGVNAVNSTASRISNLSASQNRGMGIRLGDNAAFHGHQCQ